MPQILRPDILHIEACNFIDKPVGGQLNFSRQLIKVMGNRVALVGLASSPSDPVGCWFDKKLSGTLYKYFAIGRDDHAATKPLVPGRLITWYQIRRYRKRILSIGLPNILIREPSILMALEIPQSYNLCFFNPGLDSPLSISRYGWAKYFSGYFDWFFLQSLRRKASCILAAADEKAIDDFKKRAGKKLHGKNIISFPTRVDTNTFCPADRLVARKKLGLSADAIIAVTIGRIHWAKGWPFLLEAFWHFSNRIPNSLLIFIGDGAECDTLEKQASALNLHDRVIVSGYRQPTEVATYLQASNLFIMGSLKEGWSTAMVEALACHVPIVTTRVSSAGTIVREGVNGFILDQRDPVEFSDAMEKTLNLQDISMFANNVIDRYALNNIERDLLKVWTLV